MLSQCQFGQKAPKNTTHGWKFTYKPEPWKQAKDYKLMVENAKEAGFEVIENATKEMVDKAWESKNCSHIVYYNHGTPSGKLRVDNDVSETNFSQIPVSQLFDPKQGAAERLSIACCHYPKAVTTKLMDFYNAAGIKVNSVPATQNPNGQVDRREYIRALQKFFEELNNKIEK